ncbi:MAG: peroxiredoxin [Steroidobacteraceae bacterium]
MKLWTATLVAAAALLAGNGFAAGPTAGPQAGDTAPAFKLEDQNGKWVNLSDSQGKWTVLYFYPKDMTPGCTTQACEFRDDQFAYRKANAVILGVSVDDVASHKNFEKEKTLPFTLLADYTKVVSAQYGVLGARGMAGRETFLIDPQGKIVKRYAVTPDVLANHSKLVLSDIESFKKGTKG